MVILALPAAAAWSSASTWGNLHLDLLRRLSICFHTPVAPTRRARASGLLLMRIEVKVQCNTMGALILYERDVKKNVGGD